MIKKTLFIAFGAALLSLAAQALTSNTDDTVKLKDAAKQELTEDQRAAVIAEQAPSYPLDTCVISGEKFTAESPAVDNVIDGRLIRTCCSKCTAKVKEDSAASIAKIDKAVIAQQKSLWPLKTCPVSGDAFGGEMGEPIDYVVGTRYVKLCCGGCKKAITKDSAAFMAKLDALLIPELVKSYPTEDCVVSGEKLGSMGDPIDVMYGHRLLRFCCKGCLKAYKKDPGALARQVYASKKAG